MHTSALNTTREVWLAERAGRLIAEEDVYNCWGASSRNETVKEDAKKAQPLTARKANFFGPSLENAISRLMKMESDQHHSSKGRG